MGQEPFDIKDVFAKAMNRFSAPAGSGGSGLSQLNYSPEELRDLINTRKIEVLSAAIILVAVYAAYMLYTNRSQQIFALDQQIQSLQAKIDPSKEHQKVLDENKSYISSLPLSVAQHQFISELSTIAGRYNIKINSFTPPQSTTEGFYIHISASMNCVAKDFRDALLFLGAIESSQYALKVDSFNIVPDMSSLQQANLNAGSGDLSLDQDVSPRVPMDILVVSTELIDKADDEKKK